MKSFFWKFKNTNTKGWNDASEFEDDDPKDPSADGNEELEDSLTDDTTDDEENNETDDIDEAYKETQKQQPRKIAVKEDHSLQNDADNENLDADDLFEAEGELAIDVYQTDNDIVIQSAIAGIRPEELDISIENDIVAIRGNRKNPEEHEDKQYFHEECFWGPFSRQIFLPEEVDVKNVKASLKDGILTLRLPKLELEKIKKVKLTKK